MTTTFNPTEYGISKSVTLFDYTNQAWTVCGKYIRCGHPETMDCRCYGKTHSGEAADMARVSKENGR